MLACSQAPRPLLQRMSWRHDAGSYGSLGAGRVVDRALFARERSQHATESVAGGRLYKTPAAPQFKASEMAADAIVALSAGFTRWPASRRVSQKSTPARARVAINPAAVSLAAIRPSRSVKSAPCREIAETTPAPPTTSATPGRIRMLHESQPTGGRD